jgi:23S rRNA pseudouridine1911/1915/1917 synthase
VRGTLVNALIAHCGVSLSGIGGVKRPGIVHRLDKDTSGLLVVAKTDAAHRGLSEQFAQHGRDGRLKRAYLGVGWRVPDRMRGTIDAPLARSVHNRTKIAVSHGEGAREAVTHFEVLEVYGSGGVLVGAGAAATGGGAGRKPKVAGAGDLSAKAVASLLRLELETGRTHQIRVHLAHIGHPLLGDSVYGAGFKASAGLLDPGQAAVLAGLGRQALHAAELGFRHPHSGKALHFVSALPSDLSRLIAALRRG